MAKKWELYKDVVIDYINIHPNCRVQEISNYCGTSPAVITFISKKYGLWNLLNHDNNMAKNKATKLKKYEDANYNNSEKASNTCKIRYGGVGFASEEIKHKYSNTMLQKYGVSHNWKSSDLKLNGRATMYKNAGGKKAHYNYTLSKGKQTRLEKYGDEYYSNHDKAKQTMTQKYGVEYFCVHPKCRKKLYQQSTINKRYDTMKLHNSYSFSKPEEAYYNYLLTIYNSDDIIRQYKSIEYPFYCDFYIISENRYIECNYHWTHGGHAFNATDKNDLVQLNKWKNKQTKFYNAAINTWTNLDVRKAKVAKEHNLNIDFIYDYEEVK